MKKLIALAMVLVLSGCAQIPTRVDVKSGPEIANQSEQEFAFYTPAGPIEGATQQQIVSGFLAAGTGPQGDYAVAREFLSQDFAQRWKPDASVLIRSGAPEFREVSSDLQVVSLDITAKLDEHGRYLDPANNERVSLRFQLTLEQGQWRISSAPDLTVVTAPVFAVVFQPYNVYFFDSQQQRLVPDSRWFPSRASTVTRLVNALLDGPTSWLLPAVQTAIPAGTKLTIDSVRVEDGVAQVDFDSTALSADAIGRRLMLAQIRATLLQLSGVNEVALFVNSSPQEIIPAAISPNRNSAEGMALVDGVVRLGIGNQQPLPGTAALVETYQPSLFAVNGNSTELAFASSSGVYLLSGTGLSTRTERISEEIEVAALAFDPDGLLWIIPKRSGGEIQIFGGSELLRTIVLPALGERSGAELSADGARLAVLLQSVEESRIEVFTINRDIRTRPSIINRAVVIGTVLGSPISFTWQSQVDLRVLERTASGVTALSDYPLAGPRSQLSMPPTPGKKVVSGSNAFATYLLNNTAEVWSLVGGSWRRVLTDAIDLTNSK